LRVDALHVEGDGMHAVGQHRRGRLVAVALGQELEDAQLVRCQAKSGVWRLAGLPEHGDYAARDLWRHRRTSARDVLSGFDETDWRRLLQQIPRRSGTQRLEDAVVVIVHGERDQT